MYERLKKGNNINDYLNIYEKLNNIFILNNIEEIPYQNTYKINIYTNLKYKSTCYTI